MRAMILAAGHGMRMRPLTESTPKPLLEAGGRPLLQYHLERLAGAGFRRVVINHARLGTLIEARFGDGAAFGLELTYSPEGEEPLGTGGGVRRALSRLGDAPFLLLSADIWTDFDYARLREATRAPAHLVLVPNPPHHPGGDFVLEAGRVRSAGAPRLTYSGIGVFDPALFRDRAEERFSLLAALGPALDRGDVSGEKFAGKWLDVGTPERLRDLDRELSSRG